MICSAKYYKKKISKNKCIFSNFKRKYKRKEEAMVRKCGKKRMNLIATKDS